jgi:kynureninase
MEPQIQNLLEIAQQLDREDPLATFRSEFYIPLHEDGSEQHYFCGHSLGLQPKSAGRIVQDELDAWRQLGVRGHFQGDLPWMEYNDNLCQPLSELTGAHPEEIVVMNTLTVNLHLLMISFFRPRNKRLKILMEKQAFPSDRYAVESQLRLHGLNPSECLVELEPQPGQHIVEESAIEAYLEAHGEQVALVLWPGVQYISGQAFDLERITSAAHKAGAKIGFDLAHAIGNLPLSLHDSGCDFAAWCHYKYLNSGPGAIAGCFVHEQHHGNTELRRLQGWWGNDQNTRFWMAPEFDPAVGAAAWQVSTPPILSIAPLRASLAVFQQAGMPALREKSMAMSDWLVDGIRSHLDGLLEVLTPDEPDRRGCQLSLRVRSGRTDGLKLFRYLQEHGVMTDWREPGVIRVAPTPLYNHYQDCYALLNQISDWSDSISSPVHL